MNLDILMTGASGFLGKHIYQAFQASAYNIHTIGRTRVSEQNHIHANIGKDNITLPQVHYKYVVHVAGKAHSYPRTESEKAEFTTVNLTGTVKLLEALSAQDKQPEYFIFISTVAVYGLEKGILIKECTATNPNTIYGQGKLKAEACVKNWCKKNNVKYLILRLPLIIGVDAPGNLGSMKKAIEAGKYPKIIGNNAQKSAVLASDVANFISNYKGEVSGTFHLTDGLHPSFAQIENALEKRTNKKIRMKIPLWIIKFLAKIGDVIETITKKNFPISSLKVSKLTATLSFDDTEARKKLNWKSNSVISFIENKI